MRRDPTHGAGDAHAIPASVALYEVRFPAPTAASQSYSYEVLDANGKRESSDSLPAPASGDGFLYLQIPLDSLPAGSHIFVGPRPGRRGCLMVEIPHDTLRRR